MTEGAVGGEVGTIVGAMATPLAGSADQQLMQDSATALAQSSTGDYLTSVGASGVQSYVSGVLTNIDPANQSTSLNAQSGGTYIITGTVPLFQWWLYDPDGE